MHFGDSIFIFVLALVLFGPKKLPEIGRQVGKLLAEFRRASNEFKFQIQEEIRNMEEDERRKKLAEARAQVAATTAAEPSTTTPAGDIPPPPPIVSTAPTILPPSSGETVSTGRPFATPQDEESPSTEDRTAAVAGDISENLALENVAPPVDEPAPHALPADPSAGNGAGAEHHETGDPTVLSERAHG